MKLEDRQGIALASGFILNANALLDARGSNDTLDEFKEIINGGANPHGLISFIEEDKGLYLYTGSGYVNLRQLFKGASLSQSGEAGLVPPPSAGDHTKFLRADGTWSTISSSAISGGLSIDPSWGSESTDIP